MAETTDQAKATHAELSGRLRDLRTSLAANVARRGELAFDCETGDVNAGREAAALVKALPSLEEDVRRLETAVAEAARRVARAEATDRDEAEREKAQRALDMLDAFAQRGAALDAKLSEFVEEYRALVADFRKLEALGYEPTTYPLVVNNIKRAATTKLMFAGRRHGYIAEDSLAQEFLAPYLRTDFQTAIMGWARVCKGKAEARLNRNKKAMSA